MHDGRLSPRKKIINGRVHVTLHSGSTTFGKLVDISLRGVGVFLEDPMVSQRTYSIECDIFLNGRHILLRMRAVTIHCVLVSGKGFRIGLQFLELDTATQTLITQLLA